MNPPTVRGIGEVVGLTFSSNLAHLERKGLLHMEPTTLVVSYRNVTG